MGERLGLRGRFSQIVIQLCREGSEITADMRLETVGLCAQRPEKIIISIVGGPVPVRAVRAGFTS